ncbi:MAG: thermosome subunit beta [Candidatus Korarchaeota archaeon]
MSAKGTPVLVLKDTSERSIGKAARKSNILAARAVAEIIKSNLGPGASDKMLVDAYGSVTITDDGATILKQLDVQHPASKLMVELSKAQDAEVGDGTTTVVVFAGELLRVAEELLEKNIHPSLVIKGYQKALEIALEESEKIATKVDPSDDSVLQRIAKTAMHSKIVSMYSDHLANIAVKAVKSVVENRDGKTYIDLDNVKVEKKIGGSVNDTVLVEGIILDKEVVHPDMPKVVKNARILLLNKSLEIEKGEFDAKLRITAPEQIHAFLEQEQKMLKEMIDKIKQTGANVVFCQKGIDDVPQHFLAKAGILAARRIKESDMVKLSRATGARIVSSLSEISEKDLGFAEKVEEVKIAEDNLIFVTGCKNSKSVSILIRGGTDHLTEEADRGLHDAISVVRDVILSPKIVPGGGAFELELARRVRARATSLGGKLQYVVEKFADAVEAIVSIIAENGALDPIEMLGKLKKLHEEGKISFGLELKKKKGVADMFEENVIEPLVVKQQVLSSAVEFVTMLIRIDEAIAAGRVKAPKGGEGPPGAPGEGEGGIGGESD